MFLPLTASLYRNAFFLFILPLLVHRTLCERKDLSSPSSLLLVAATPAATAV